MVAKITSLIDKQDSFEIVRDKIALILLEEEKSQQALAVSAGKDPRLFELRVFIERTNPWSEYQDAPTDQLDAPPIINITYETSNADKSASNPVVRQQMDVTYNIDCYGYGVSSATDTGHVAGDEQAAIVSHRAAKLVRNILMASFYVKLDLPKDIVGLRWVASITSFTPELDSRPVQNVIGTRIAFQVKMNEFSPQAEGEPLEVVSVTVFRGDGAPGEVFLVAQYGEETP